MFLIFDCKAKIRKSFSVLNFVVGLLNIFIYLHFQIVIFICPKGGIFGSGFTVLGSFGYGVANLPESFLIYNFCISLKKKYIIFHFKIKYLLRFFFFKYTQIDRYMTIDKK